MADSTSVAVPAAPVPKPAAIRRVEDFTREQLIYEGEDVAVALEAGSVRRVAFDMANDEIESGAKVPSTAWRRRFSLLLGLERVLSEDEPRLADGTLLNPHQVDALSGTLTALLAEAQRGANGNGRGNGAPVGAPAPAAIPGEEELEEDVPDDEEPVDYDDPSI